LTSFRQILLNFLFVFKKLCLIFQRRDLVLGYVKVHVATVPYFLDKQEDATGPVEKETLLRVFQCQENCNKFSDWNNTR
jgi:hypothetical protein